MATDHDRGPTWRRVVAMTLVVVVGIVTPLMLVGVWVRNLVLDTDRWVETVAPLADDEAVQDAVATRVSDYFETEVDIEAQIEGLLPDNLQRLAPPLALAAERAVDAAVGGFVSSDAFPTLWEEANRLGHTTVQRLVTGETKNLENVSLDEGAVTVDLGGVAEKAAQQLADRGIGFFEDVEVKSDDLQLTVIESEQLAKVQDAVDLLQKVAWVLVAAAIVGTALALVVSTDRRRTLLHLGVAWIIGAIVLGVGLLIGRSVLVDQLPDEVRDDVAETVYTQLVSLLRIGLRTVLVLGIVCAVGAWLAGPSRWATAIRSPFTGGLDKVGAMAGGGDGMGGFGSWVNRNVGALRVAGLVGAGLLLLLGPDRRSPWTILWIALLFLLYLVVVEVIARADRATRQT